MNKDEYFSKAGTMMDDRIHFHADSSNKHNSENPERVVNARLKRK